MPEFLDGWRIGAVQGFSQGSLGEIWAVGLYLALMGLLGLFGSHRLFLVWLYLRRNPAPPAPGLPGELPRVTVQLPVYNERFVVLGLIESACRLDYPRDRLQIQVLDDSTDETTHIARTAVERMASRGFPIEFHHRDNREGYKAGALEAGMRTATGELLALFDADFTPNPDFLLRTVGHFSDGRVGMVQARWTYRNREHSLLTRVQAMLLDGHFVIEHGARFGNGLFFNFNGTAGVLRRQMIEDAGGWQHDTLTEDTDLSYRAQLKGWEFIYRNDIEAPSELPVDICAFHAQQARWAKGLIQTGIKLLPRIFRAPIPLRRKLEAFFHLAANCTYPAMALMTLIMPAAMAARFRMFDPWFLLLDIPLFLGTFGSLALFYLFAHRELFGRGWVAQIKLVPLLMAAGIGLTFNNTRAVIEALAGIQTPFQRTAKYSTKRDQASLARHFYGLRAGWITWANLAVASAFFAFTVQSIGVGNWFALPFVMLFASSFAFAGGMAVYQSLERRAIRQIGELPKTHTRSQALSG